MKVIFYICVFVLFLFFTGLNGFKSTAEKSPLQEYVNRPDPYFNWNISSDSPLVNENFTVYNLFLTSQKWLTEQDFNENKGSSPIWKHWIQICIPNNFTESELATLWVDGGSTKKYNQPRGLPDFILGHTCTQSHIVSVGLYQIPNQPLYFEARPEKRTTEDSLIAYTWAHYVNHTQEPDWLARMPMTKASIKALDAIQDFFTLFNSPNSPIPKPDNLPANVPSPQKFIVSGASKRGWTAWMAGCMNDDRIIAIVPVVAPIANLVPQMNEMFESYGTYSFALIDYVNVGLMPGFLNEPVFQELLDNVDPLNYPEEMEKTPKFVVVAAGDEFFMPDSAQYYWNKLKGVKHLRVVPNAEHAMVGSIYNVINTAIAYGHTFMKNSEHKLPEYEWDISGDGQTIKVKADPENLIDVRVWYSKNNKRRDWRLVRCVEEKPECVNPAFFLSKKLTLNPEGEYEYTLDEPDEDKYSAFMIQLDYDVGDLEGVPLRVTSDLSIVPRNKFPYPKCPNDVCKCAWDCPKEGQDDPEHENYHWFVK